MVPQDLLSSVRFPLLLAEGVPDLPACLKYPLTLPVTLCLHKYLHNIAQGVEPVSSAQKNLPRTLTYGLHCKLPIQAQVRTYPLCQSPFRLSDSQCPSAPVFAHVPAHFHTSHHVSLQNDRYLGNVPSLHPEYSLHEVLPQAFSSRHMHFGMFCQLFQSKAL